MWAKFSKLNACLRVHENIDIATYGKLFAYLKSILKSYKPKKVLEKKNIEQFLKEASDKDNFFLVLCNAGVDIITLKKHGG